MPLPWRDSGGMCRRLIRAGRTCNYKRKQLACAQSVRKERWYAERRLIDPFKASGDQLAVIEDGPPGSLAAARLELGASGSSDSDRGHSRRGGSSSHGTVAVRLVEAVQHVAARRPQNGRLEQQKQANIREQTTWHGASTSRSVRVTSQARPRTAANHEVGQYNLHL